MAPALSGRPPGSPKECTLEARGTLGEPVYAYAMRSFAFVCVVALTACGSEVRPYPSVTLAVAVSGPGVVRVTGGVEARCTSSCELPVPRGAEVSLAATSRAGATFSGFDGACSGAGECSMRVGEETRASATFAWDPLPPVTRYAWRCIGDDAEWIWYTHLDSSGNAYGATNGATFGELVPIRYDALTDTIAPLAGLGQGWVIAANDAGDVVVQTDLGPVRYREGAATFIGSREESLWPSDISDEGWIVGTRRTDLLHGDYGPWLDDGTSLRTIGDGEPRAQANAIDSSGRVVGETYVEHFFWDGSAWLPYAVEIRMTGLELLPIGFPSTARDLSDTGLVLGNTHVDHTLRGKSYLYDLGARSLQVIEPLEDDLSIILEHINPSGTVAVGYGARSFPQRERVIVFLVSEGRIVDLASLVNLPAGWQLRGVQSVNVHGQILATVREGVDVGCTDLILTPE